MLNVFARDACKDVSNAVLLLYATGWGFHHLFPQYSRPDLGNKRSSYLAVPALSPAFTMNQVHGHIGETTA